MEVPGAVVITGELLFKDLSPTVNWLLGVAYPELHAELSMSPLVFMPATATGTLLEMPQMQEVPVQENSSVWTELTANDGTRLLGFPLLVVGEKFAFQLGRAHLTMTRRERTVGRPGSRVDMEFVYIPTHPEEQDFKQCLHRVESITVAAATEEQARRLLPA